MHLSNYTPDVRVGNPSRFTSGLIKASLGAGVAWFGYQLANEIAAHQSILNQSPVATIAFLALALSVAAFVAMRQQAELAEQSQVWSRTELTKKTMPLFENVFSGWLDYPEYFFYWCYHSGKSIFNTMYYQSPQMDTVIDGARAAAATGDLDTYNKDVKGFVDLAFTDMPRIPLYQPYVNVAMQKNISGYQYWFHRRLDYRSFVKA